jgi:hypothetical protein
LSVSENVAARAGGGEPMSAPRATTAVRRGRRERRRVRGTRDIRASSYESDPAPVLHQMT